MLLLDSDEIIRRIGAKQIRFCQFTMLALFIDVIALHFFSQYGFIQFINTIIVTCLLVNAGMIIYKFLKYNSAKYK
ncbi:hypothetical protein [Clostridium folliculivorans]|uniref:Uncharacterized protein n=1 Tax=Clostridium folliculivorans TaxID=2886038 RepID=A0A9W5Y2D1_9CLOT|nr:hypothetical protein [Clostridium folliculivorans]GKU25182.1 hypothetical protein CFOLD11_20080 [Clostridium folliculivorans]GKU31280.1 hypothetical protein CFB3_33870 [Clostridium folliculivorans]